MLCCLGISVPESQPWQRGALGTPLSPAREEMLSGDHSSPLSSGSLALEGEISPGPPALPALSEGLPCSWLLSASPLPWPSSIPAQSPFLHSPGGFLQLRDGTLLSSLLQAAFPPARAHLHFSAIARGHFPEDAEFPLPDRAPTPLLLPKRAPGFPQRCRAEQVLSLSPPLTPHSNVLPVPFP